jgi:hypothetical protein
VPIPAPPATATRRVCQRAYKIATRSAGARRPCSAPGRQPRGLWLQQDSAERCKTVAHLEGIMYTLLVCCFCVVSHGANPGTPLRAPGTPLTASVPDPAKTVARAHQRGCKERTRAAGPERRPATAGWPWYRPHALTSCLHIAPAGLASRSTGLHNRRDQSLPRVPILVPRYGPQERRCSSRHPA